MIKKSKFNRKEILKDLKMILKTVEETKINSFL